MDLEQAQAIIAEAINSKQMLCVVGNCFVE